MKKWLWTGWILCALTLSLFVYMAAFEAPAISVLIDGMRLPDALLLGYDAEGARTLQQAFASDLAEAKTAGRQSASTAYVSLHAGSDLLFPPMLAISMVFVAFTALRSGASQKETPRWAPIVLGLVMVLAFVYLGSDFVENAMTDAMFGPQAVNSALNDQWVFALRVVTAGKFLSVAVAIVLIAALWLTRLRSRR